MHHILATWCVFNVTKKSNWQYCTASNCTCHFLSWHAIPTGCSSCFSHNCNAVNSDVIQRSKLWLQKKHSATRPALFKFIRRDFLFHTVWCETVWGVIKKKKGITVHSITTQKSDFHRLPVLHNIRNAHWSWNFRSQTSPTSGSH